ncbi:hypothetical protein BGZ76_006016 [Entomortierella beljakovae]|nr:hypothetical protein BGZ76_006016 [Entomortierella beljakovae]
MSNQKATANKITWKQVLSSLDHQEYFGSISSPHLLYHFGFFESINTPAAYRDSAEAEWQWILQYFTRSNVEVLQQVAISLKASWESDVEMGKIERFWSNVALSDTVESHNLSSLEVNTSLNRSYTYKKAKKHPLSVVRTPPSSHKKTKQAIQPEDSLEPDDSLGSNSAPASSSSSPPIVTRKPLSILKTVKFVDEDLGSHSSKGDEDFVGSDQSSSPRSSLNISDFRYVNHLVGPGTTSSHLRTSSRFKVGQMDISEIIMNARREIVKNQSRIEKENTSDLLSLNFIFDSEFVKKNLPANIFAMMTSVKIPVPERKEVEMLSDCAVFAATHSFSETKKYIRNFSDSKTMISDILEAYTSRPSLWHDTPPERSDQQSLTRNEDTYIADIVRNIVCGVFSDLDIIDHWGRDPLPKPTGFEETYYPDYFGESAGFPFIVVEVKKPGVSQDVLEGDKRKLPSMMKLMLDRLHSAYIQNPVVLGFLIGGRLNIDGGGTRIKILGFVIHKSHTDSILLDSRCSVVQLTLDYEAIYQYKRLGQFELPRNNFQLGLLLPALGPLLAAKVDIV